jgi:hypothetical protein
MPRHRSGGVAGDTPFLKTFLLALASFGAMPGAFGGSAMDAYEASSKAHNDYARELSRLGPKRTPEQMKDARSKLIVPAAVQNSQAATKIYTEQESKTRQHIFDKLKKKIGSKLVPSWVLNPGTKGKTTASSGKDPGGTGTTTKSTGTSNSYKRDEVVIDGSNVPKEIEFTPEAKPSAKPGAKKPK